MDIDLDVLNQITETAVKAAGMRDYDIGPLRKRHLRPDGVFFDTDIDPPPRVNRLHDLESCVAAYSQHKEYGAEIFVGMGKFGESIINYWCGVTQDKTRTTGRSVCVLKCSEAIVKIYEKQDANLTPEGGWLVRRDGLL